MGRALGGDITENTMTTDINRLRREIAIRKGRLAFRERANAEAEAAKAEFEKAQTAAEAAFAEYEKFLTRGPGRKIKAGRPGKWRGYLGFSLVTAVDDIRKKQKCTIATAIRRIKREKGVYPQFSGHSYRDLQKRYQEGRQFWGFMRDSDEYGRQRKAHETKYVAAAKRRDAALAAYNRAVDALFPTPSTGGLKH